MPSEASLTVLAYIGSKKPGGAELHRRASELQEWAHGFMRLLGLMIAARLDRLQRPE